MKQLLLAAVILGSITACNAQNSERTKVETNGATVHLDNKPLVTSKVNKRFDDNGNLIGYDSTAVWSYSSHANNNVVADSMMAEVRRQFSHGFDGFGYGFEGAAFANDSLFYRPFIMHGFPAMEKMMRQMDSLSISLFSKPKPDRLPTYEN